MTWSDIARLMEWPRDGVIFATMCVNGSFTLSDICQASLYIPHVQKFIWQRPLIQKIDHIFNLQGAVDFRICRSPRIGEVFPENAQESFIRVRLKTYIVCWLHQDFEAPTPRLHIFGWGTCTTLGILSCPTATHRSKLPLLAPPHLHLRLYSSEANHTTSLVLSRIRLNTRTRPWVFKTENIKIRRIKLWYGSDDVNKTPYMERREESLTIWNEKDLEAMLRNLLNTTGKPKQSKKGKQRTWGVKCGRHSTRLVDELTSHSAQFSQRCAGEKRPRVKSLCIIIM